MSDKKKRSSGLAVDRGDGLSQAQCHYSSTALPAIAHTPNRSLSRCNRIISYTLTAMLIPVSGWLADRFGTRHFYPCRESVHIGFSGLRTF